MGTYRFAGHALSIVAAAALLSACGGSSALTTMPDNAGNARPAATGNKAFYYTGGEQSFKVPPGVKSVTVVLRGAAGAGQSIGKNGKKRDYFGLGGRVYAVIPVQPGETLYVFVGGQGSATGGFNGGGSPGASYGPGYGGGGASDVREGGDNLSDRILVTGGGGGQGANDSSRGGAGGAGGGSVGGTGGSYSPSCDVSPDFSSYCFGGGGGTGGTQSRGGSGGAGGKGINSSPDGYPGSSGALGIAGNGGQGGAYGGSGGSVDAGGGGGAGGGYYGGGGGGGGGGAYASLYGGPGGGGGGGSSYVEPSAVKFHVWRGWKNATTNGLAVFSW